MLRCWFCYKDSGKEEYHSKCSNLFFGTDEVPLLQLDNNLLEKLADKTINKHIAVTGVQPKLSVTLDKSKNQNRLTITGLWGEYILKPQHAAYPYMPETESLTMHLAAEFKIHVCEHTLLKATDGRLVYIAKRFDRNKGNKIHVEDLCQLSEFLTENKYKGSYEKTGKLISAYCAHTGLDTLNYFELVLFSYLSGNNDMHLKNFSLVHGENGIALSPAYDLLNVNLINPKDDEELALTLNGKNKKIKISDFTALASTLKIPGKATQNIYKKFSSANAAVKRLIDASFLGKKEKKKYWEIWMKKQEIFS